MATTSLEKMEKAQKKELPAFTREDRLVWQLLYAIQIKNLSKLVYSPIMKALKELGINEELPDFETTAQKLKDLSGWTAVPVLETLSPHDYYKHLSKRRYPTRIALRKREKVDQTFEADYFHDLFGYFPLLCIPTTAKFLEQFGKLSLKAETKEQQMTLQRYYCFTVGYGLIKEGKSTRILGGEQVASIKDAMYSLSNKVQKQPFDLDAVTKQNFIPHFQQPLLFVIEDIEQIQQGLDRIEKVF